MVALSLLLFAVVYGVLMAVDIYLLAKYGKAGPVDDDAQQPVPAAA